MRRKRPLLIFVAFAVIAAVLTGCSATDVVRKYSRESLDAITKTFPALTGAAAVNGYFTITVDNQTFLKVSNDFKASGKEDILLQTPLKPFTDAGLKIADLGAGYKVAGADLYLTGDYGDGTGVKGNFGDALFEAVQSDRTMLTYHQALDHYGIKLLKGKFEWAKTYGTNDKDIVFVIAAKPLADLGVDVRNIAGWAFLTLQDPDGSSVDVLAKPYDMK
jgi:hypothetical protein